MAWRPSHVPVSILDVRSWPAPGGKTAFASCTAPAHTPSIRVRHVPRHPRLGNGAGPVNNGAGQVTDGGRRVITLAVGT